jgi:hypothetical protein
MALTKIGIDAISGAIQTSNIADAAVTSAKIATGGVATVDMADGSVTSLKIVDGGIATADIADGAVTLAKLSATGTKDSTTFLRGDNSFQVVAVTPTAVSDQANSSTGYFDLPSGTTAQRPGSANSGYTRYNTDTGSLEFYNGTNWISTNLIPTVNSITGNIYAGIESSLSISVTNATDIITVRFSEGGSIVSDVGSISVTSGTASVTLPSAVYNQTAGDTITISILNQDGTPSSNNISKTLLTVPTGGTRTASGLTFTHAFSAGTTSFNTQGRSLVADVLMVAGGGGGGAGNGLEGGEGSGGGGGGAGGLVFWDDLSISSGTYSMVVGSGGTGSQSEGGIGSNGGNTTGFGYTALGGGGAASHETTQRSNSGGSGGGNHDRNNDSGAAPGIQNSTYGYGFGNNGGTGYDLTSGDRYESGAGGGGAGAVGQNSNRGNVDNTPGNGGAGRDYSSVYGTSYGDSGWFAGGGGGGGGNGTYTSVFGTGGQGGGGRGGGGATPPSVGTNGTGGGGGGGQGSTVGARGGDGIILIKYTLS